MQTTVASLLEETPTADIVNTTRECVDQMTQDIAGLQDNYTKFTMNLWQILKSLKEVTSGLGTSHNWVLGASWGLRAQNQKSCLFLEKITKTSGKDKEIMKKSSIESVER